VNKNFKWVRIDFFFWFFEHLLVLEKNLGHPVVLSNTNVYF
jgi:hypothetical protein